MLARDGLAQRGDSPGRGVLVVAVAQRLGRGLDDPRIGVEVRKALREVDGAVGPVELEVQSRHLPDDRLGEALRLQ